MKFLSWKFLIVFLVLVIAGFIFFGYWSSRVEQPKYQVLNSQGNIQLREYPPVIVAEVRVKGERDQAIRDGFRLLADYIFGNNTRSTKIAMTAPVSQQSERISMTAPVSQQQMGANNAWQVRFMMPAQYTMETLPKPNNDVVKIKAIESTKRVVIQFSGYASESNLTDHLTKLKDYLKTQNIKVIGEPIYAFYNPPWTLPFLRTNEIQYTVRDQ